MKGSEKEHLNSVSNSSSSSRPNSYGSNGTDNRGGSDSTLVHAYPVLPPVTMPQHYSTSIHNPISSSQIRVTESGVEMQSYNSSTIPSAPLSQSSGLQGGPYQPGEIIYVDEKGQPIYLDENGKPITTYVEEVDREGIQVPPQMVFIKDNKEYQVLGYTQTPDVSVPSGDAIRKEREDDAAFYEDKTYSYESTEYTSVYDKTNKKNTKQDENIKNKQESRAGGNFNHNDSQRIVYKKNDSGSVETTVIPEDPNEEVITYYHHRDSTSNEPNKEDDSNGYKIPEYTPMYK